LKKVIAISGPPGSGKTTYAKFISEKFNLRYVSAGKIFRELANKLNMNLDDFHKLAEKDYSYDIMVDNISIEEANKGNVVIEGHLSCWILKDIADLKIYLNAPLEERIRRLMERDKKSYDEVKEEILNREKSNKLRFKLIYGINIEDFSNIDLMINTSILSKEEIFEILTYFLKFYFKEKI